MGKIVDVAFSIYAKRFVKQLITTIIVNLIFFGLTAAILWGGFWGIVPNQTSFLGGVYVAAATVIAVVFVMLLFQFLVTGATIITGHDERVGFARGLPYILSVFFAQMIIYMPFALLFGFIAYSTRLNRSVILSMTAIVIMLFPFISTVLSLSVPIALIEKKLFMAPIKKSVNIVTSKNNFLCFFGMNIIWKLIYWSAFAVVMIIAFNMLPTPAYIARLPFSNYFVLPFDAFLAYLATLVIFPIGKDIVYAAYRESALDCKLPCSAPPFGFGAKLFAFAIDFYLLLTFFLAALFIVFILFDTQDAVFTVALPLSAWIAVILMLTMSTLAYRFVFKRLINRKTPGEKIISG